MITDEIWKRVIDSGLFGLICLWSFWVMFRAWPEYLKALSKQAGIHKEAIVQQSADNKEALLTVCTAFNRTTDVLVMRIEKEGELNRATRHDTANKIHEAVIRLVEFGKDHDANGRLDNSPSRKPKGG